MKYNKSNRIRYRMKYNNKNNLPRIVVTKSEKNIFAQMILDGNVIAHASTQGKACTIKGYNVEGAREIGRMIGQQAKNLGIPKVIFDRSGYNYTGRIAALADGAREFVEI